MECKSLNSIAVLFLFQANCDSLVPLCIDQIVKGNVLYLGKIIVHAVEHLMFHTFITIYKQLCSYSMLV